MNYQFKKPRRRALSLLLISCALLAAAMPSPQEEDDVTRRLWNKQFLEAREEAKKPRPSAQAPTAKTKSPTTVKPMTKPVAAGGGIVDG